MPLRVDCLWLLFVLGWQQHPLVHGEAMDQTNRPETLNSINPNSPNHTAFVYSIDALPSSGSAREPVWAATYLAQYLDSANVRWNASDPRGPVAKYQAAFHTPPGLEDRISAIMGVDNVAGSAWPCSSSATSCQQGTTCAIRPGRTQGYCITTWSGSCDRWAAAALMEPAPRCPVTHNNVTFYVPDIKALVILSFSQGLTSSVMGIRCTDQSPWLDPTGRTMSAACRDVNPGAFLLALTNLMGIQRRGFVGDLSAYDAVWNYPLYSYSITRNVQLNSFQACDWVNGYDHSFPVYVWNYNAVDFRLIDLQVNYVTEATTDDIANAHNVTRYLRSMLYQMVVELDDHGNVLGGEWVGSSKTHHPDVLWIPNAKAPNTSVSDIEWAQVQMLLQTSQQCM